MNRANRSMLDGAGLLIVLSCAAFGFTCTRSRTRSDDSVPVPTAPVPAPRVVPAPAPPVAEVPQAMSAAGSWTTMFGGGSGGGNSPVNLTIIQVGNAISGTYRPTPGGPPSNPGAISGTLDGAVISGTWRDTQPSSGTFTLTLSPDGQSFTGTWASANLSGTWNGGRDANPAPTVLNQPDPVPAPEPTSSQYADVRGTWLTRYGATAIRMQFRQNLPGESGPPVLLNQPHCRDNPGKCVFGSYANVGGGGEGTFFGILDDDGIRRLMGDWTDRGGLTGGLVFTFAQNGQSFTGFSTNRPVSSGRANLRPNARWNGERE